MWAGHRPLWRERKSGSASRFDEAQSHSHTAGRIPLRKLWEYVDFTSRPTEMWSIMQERQMHQLLFAFLWLTLKPRRDQPAGVFFCNTSLLYTTTAKFCDDTVSPAGRLNRFSIVQKAEWERGMPWRISVPSTFLRI